MSSHKLEYYQRDSVKIARFENAHAQAEISLLGGQILSFIPHHDHRERLWLSKNASFDGTRPIRGGIPICWPWFGSAPEFLNNYYQLPAHGYVRNCEWKIQRVSDQSEGTLVVLEPEIDYTTQAFPDLQVSLQVLIGAQLNVELITVNQGNPISFYAALHSYLAVEDITSTCIEGLDCPYFDKVTQSNDNPAQIPYVITGETDRVHPTTIPTVTIKNDSQQTTIHSCGHDSIVVWNPWKALSQAMPDMEPDGYRHMLCVETARTQENSLALNKSHCLSQTIA
ncbi:D-hexose-6-phosphate mutarotase [Alteromonas flava]|uniref:D-hexose-6-phosphate mutarotase n=1 Tax=Alteromonas flava TaxID=2048003 RepID=UPI000C28BDA2|nr:D-hexose-6-phosphate mutarotase [Alteromonas flava]